MDANIEEDLTTAGKRVPDDPRNATVAGDVTSISYSGNLIMIQRANPCPRCGKGEDIRLGVCEECRLKALEAVAAKNAELNDHHWLLREMDGAKWAEEFVRIYGGNLDLMRTWFCGAILTGYNYCERGKRT